MEYARFMDLTRAVLSSIDAGEGGEVKAVRAGHIGKIEAGEVKSYLETVSALLEQYRPTTPAIKKFVSPASAGGNILEVEGYKIKFWTAKDNPEKRYVFINDSGGEQLGRVWSGKRYHIAEEYQGEVPQSVIDAAMKYFVEKTTCKK